MTSFGALFPVGTTPEESVNFESLANFAATTGGMFLGQIAGGIGGIAAAFLLNPVEGIENLLEIVGDANFTDLVISAFDGMVGVFFDLLPGFQIISQFLGVDLTNLEDFNLVDAVTNFVVNILNPLNLLAQLDIFGLLPLDLIPGLDASTIISGTFPLEMITGLVDLIGGFLGIGDITEAITGILGGDLGDVSNFFQNIIDFIGIDLNVDSGSFDIIGAATDFIEGILDPTGLLALLNPFGFLSAGVIPGLDASQIVTGSFPQTIVTGLTSLASNALGWIDGFFNAVTGQSQTSVPLANTNQQVQLMAETLSSTAAAVADMVAERTGSETNSGLSASDDFERTSSTNLGGNPPWRQTYSGAGAHVLATPGGHEAALIKSGTTYRRCIAQNTDPDTAVTLTDYQVVTKVIGNSVISYAWFAESDAHDDLYARMNAAGTHYVRLRIRSSVADLWYAAGGAEVQLGSSFPAPQSVGATFSLIAGTNAGIRRFQVVKNGSVIFDYNDAGNVTSVGASFRGWGFGMGASADTPSSITRVTVADNAPVAVTGTTMRVSRAATSAIVKGPGSAALPNATFDTVDYITPDLAWNAATSTLTVTKSGTYLFSLRVSSSSVIGFSESWAPLLYVGGVLKAAGGQRTGNSANGFGVPALPQDLSAGGDAMLYYLAAGQTVQPGFVNTVNNINIVGDAGGTSTWFAVTRLG